MAGKTLVVYSINEHKGKSFWTRVGAAFVNNDGSINVVLNCMPLDGKLQIREPNEKEGS